MHKPSLLIVDDERSVLLTPRLVFEDAISACSAVTTAYPVAVQLLRQSTGFDAVLTDMSLEHDQSGLVVANAAARLHPRPVIVIFTGYGTIENVKGAIRIAVDHFALKPIDVDEFKHALARLLALRVDRLTIFKGR